jgi:hypothetical protein
MLQKNIKPEEAERIYGILHKAYEEVDDDKLAETIDKTARSIMESCN